MFGLGPTEILVIVVLLVVIFGAKKLPAVGRGLGQAMKEFREAEKGEEKTEGPSKPPEAVPSTEKKGLMENVPGLKEYTDMKAKINKVRKITRSF